MSLERDDRIIWQPILKLYEGTHCFSYDLDGETLGRARSLQPNFNVRGAWLRSWNRAEDTPGDWVRVDYEVHHSAR